METPPGECPQCWHHAHVVHRSNLLGIGEEDCKPCLDHMVNGCPSVTPKKKSSWW